MPLRKWLADNLKRTGISQAQLTRELSARMSQKFHPTQINKMLSGERDIGFDEAMALSLIFGIEPPTPRRVRTVPVIGHVSAGAAAHLFGMGQGMLDIIDAPPTFTDTTVAVKVIGDSMYGTAPDGSYIYYDSTRAAPTTDMVGKMCVVGLDDGRVMVKTLRLGTEPGIWRLESVNAPPIENAKLEWAARVTWIKPG